MSGLCIATALGAMLAALPVERFTLAWTHSVEKIHWEEDYELRDGRLHLTAARVRGHGAGMEIPEGARRRGDAWEYRPATAPLAVLTLAASPYGGDYELCVEGRCRRLRELAPADGPVTLSECRGSAGRDGAEVGIPGGNQ
jgi:hypothetical protein